MTENNSMHRNVDIHSVMLGNIPVQLSNCVRNLGFVFDSHLNLNEEINYVKRNVIVNLIDQDSKMKLVHGLVFSIIFDVCTAHIDLR